jgi:hypothetical protein
VPPQRRRGRPVRRSLAHHARPGPEAIAAHVAATDPAATLYRVGDRPLRRWLRARQLQDVKRRLHRIAVCGRCRPAYRLAAEVSALRRRLATGQEPTDADIALLRRIACLAHP